MSKRTFLGISIPFLVVAVLVAIMIPSILKVKNKTYVVQQMASFREICQSIEDHNKLPVQLSIQGIEYEPNALGHSDQILFYRKCFNHEIITYGNGHWKLLNGKGEIESEGDVFYRDKDEIIFREYTGSEPYRHHSNH